MQISTGTLQSTVLFLALEMFSRKCCFDCEGKLTHFSLPIDLAVFDLWMGFVFPGQKHSWEIIWICSLHFTDNSFMNKSRHWHCRQTVPKTLVVPTLKRHESEPQSVSETVCQMSVYKLIFEKILWSHCRKKLPRRLTVLYDDNWIHKTTELIHLLLLQLLRNMELLTKAIAQLQVQSIFTRHRHPAVIFVVTVCRAAHFDI